MLKTNPDLPRYKKDSNKPRKTKTSKPPGNAVIYDKEGAGFALDLLASESTREALLWLEEKDVPMRTLGENIKSEMSIAFVKSLYDIGAKKVWVFDIDDYGEKGQNSGKLIIEFAWRPPKTS